MRALLAVTFVLGCLPAAGDGCFVSRATRRDIQEPEQKALIVHQNGIQDLILQVKYSGAVEDFAWIVPTPGVPRVNLCDPNVFTALSHATNPPRGKGGGGFGGGGLGGFGGPQVAVIDRKLVGVYDVSVLAANDSGALLRWLNGHGYSVSARLNAVVSDYIRRGFVFTAMRIDPSAQTGKEIQKAESETAVKPESAKAEPIPSNGLLQPIRLTFSTPKPIFPLKISSLNGGVTDLLLYLMTPQPVVDVGLRREFIGQMKADGLNRITGGSPRIESALWLTKLTARIPASRMTEDLVFGYRHPGALTPLSGPGE